MKKLLILIIPIILLFGCTNVVSTNTEVPVSTGYKVGEALIEGEVVCENSIIKNENYAKIVKGISAGSKPELHVYTAYYSTTLGETVLIDNHTPSGERQVYRLVDLGKGPEWTRVFTNGKGKKDEPMEQALQAYNVMRGMAKAIDGKSK